MPTPLVITLLDQAGNTVAADHDITVNLYWADDIAFITAGKSDEVIGSIRLETGKASLTILVHPRDKAWNSVLKITTKEQAVLDVTVPIVVVDKGGR